MRINCDRNSSFAALVITLALSSCDGAAGSPGAAARAAPSGASTRVAAVVAPGAARPGEPAHEIYKIPLGDSPARGGAAPKVTMVVFSEFQCPFCARVEPTLAQLLARYGDDLGIVWKHAPLPFHERALPAALASEVARAEGRFWPMHDRLFAERGALGTQDLAAHAQAVGLDPARFSAALADPALKARVDADRALGETFGVRGTPTFFINGRRLVGAQPIEVFAAAIDEERARADQALRTGVDRARLYAALTEGGLDKAIPEPAEAADARPAGCAGNCPAGGCNPKAAAPAADDPAHDATVYKVDVGTSPARGRADAPITLVLFSDFQCPFCKRVEPTIAALEQAYPGQIRVVWKNFPLPFHESARPAARLALFAHQSGKFWAMHDRLIETQSTLDPSALERDAQALGLDEAGWKAALGGDEGGAAIDADVKLGAALGVTGTPTVFINGRRIAGAYPLDTFRAIVDEELAKQGAKKGATREGGKAGPRRG